MKNKRIIVVFSILLAATLLAVLAGVLFSVKTAEVSLHGTTHVLKTDEVAADFRAEEGKSIFFLRESDIIKELEAKHPYLFCINVERNFPDKAILHAYERKELFAVTIADKPGEYAVTDFTGKVLSVRAGNVAVAPLGDITGNIPVDAKLPSDVKAGSTVTDKLLRNVLAAYEAYINLADNTADDFRAFAADISVTEAQMVINTRQGTAITVLSPSDDIVGKIRLAVGLVLDVTKNPAYGETALAGWNLIIKSASDFDSTLKING